MTKMEEGLETAAKHILQKVHRGAGWKITIPEDQIRLTLSTKIEEGITNILIYLNSRLSGQPLKYAEIDVRCPDCGKMFVVETEAWIVFPEFKPPALPKSEELGISFFVADVSALPPIEARIATAERQRDEMNEFIQRLREKANSAPEGNEQ